MSEMLMFESVFPIGGVADGREAVFCDNIYLLNSEGTVLSCRATRKMPVIGSNFFAELDTARGELTALSRSLARGERGAYLMQCGPLPVLVMRYPFTADGSLLVAIPEGELAVALRTPAAYDGKLFPDLQFSPLSATKEMPYRQEIFEAAKKWILPYLRVVARDGERHEEASELMQILIARTFRLASLCGVRAEYDFSGIGFASVRGVDYSLMTAELLAVMMLANRAATDKLVLVSLERAVGEDPTIYARMRLTDPADSLDELAALCRAARLRGIRFETFLDPERQGMLHLRLGFCAAELSVQQLRNPFKL